MQENEYELDTSLIFAIGVPKKVHEIIKDVPNATAIKNGKEVSIKENGEMCDCSLLFDRIYGIDRNFDREHILLYLDKDAVVNEI